MEEWVPSMTGKEEEGEGERQTLAHFTFSLTKRGGRGRIAKWWKGERDALPLQH